MATEHEVLVGVESVPVDVPDPLDWTEVRELERQACVILLEGICASAKHKEYEAASEMASAYASLRDSRRSG